MAEHWSGVVYTHIRALTHTHTASQALHVAIMSPLSSLWHLPYLLFSSTSPCLLLLIHSWLFFCFLFFLLPLTTTFASLSAHLSLSHLLLSSHPCPLLLLQTWDSDRALLPYTITTWKSASPPQKMKQCFKRKSSPHLTGSTSFHKNTTVFFSKQGLNNTQSHREYNWSPEWTLWR